MTIGLPEHLARASLSRALTRAGHAAAGVCLLAGLAVAIASVVDGQAWGVPEPRAAAVIVVALLAAQALAQGLVVRWPNVTLTLVALVVGAGVSFGMTEVVMVPGSDFESTNNALLALPRIALVLVGGAGIGSGIAITWAVLGFGIGEAAALLGVAVIGTSLDGDPAAGAVWVPNLAAVAALVIVVVVRTFDSVARRGAARREAGLYRASRQTRELAIRHDYELRAIARLHDTALSHLVAVATSGSGPVDERLRADIRHDLALIVGRDWAIDSGESEAPRGAPRGGAGASSGGPSRPDGAGPLAEAVELAEHAGLTVRLAGDPSVLQHVTAGRRDALRGALGQCLMNVVRHARVDEAEVAVGATEQEVTVAVIDGGAGFDVDRVPVDRIGLRTSIRGRIEQEGGTVQVWSRPGAGTTVLLSVPAGDGA